MTNSILILVALLLNISSANAAARNYLKCHIDFLSNAFGKKTDIKTDVLIYSSLIYGRNEESCLGKNNICVQFHTYGGGREQVWPIINGKVDTQTAGAINSSQLDALSFGPNPFSLTEEEIKNKNFLYQSTVQSDVAFSLNKNGETDVTDNDDQYYTVSGSTYWQETLTDDPLYYILVNFSMWDLLNDTKISLTPQNVKTISHKTSYSMTFKNGTTYGSDETTKLMMKGVITAKSKKLLGLVNVPVIQVNYSLNCSAAEKELIKQTYSR